jgi:ABC-2 type transport system permease protein
MNIYKRELRANRRSLILWCIGLFLFIGASMGKYSALAKDPVSLNIFNGLPMGLQAVFGVTSFDFLKALGFFGMIFPYLILMAAIHASMLGAGILSKEERDRTSEFLYVKPATRARIVTAKLLAALTCVVILNLVTWAVSVMLVGHFAVAGEPVAEGVARLMLGLFCVQILFLSLGLAAAAVLKQPKAAPGVTTGVMLATYILSIAIDVNGKIGWLKGFTPFEYFDAKLIIGHETGNLLAQGLNGWYVALSLAMTAVFITAAYLFFRKRDLKV